jgi:oxygen-dependent protoporphyrinogen oxidase
VASVVVVGAGLAGLACAFRLARAGHEVELLEREAEAGGRARRDPGPGLALAARPALSLRGDANLEALLALLGLGSALEELPAPALGILREGRLVRCDAASPLRLLASAPLGAGARVRALALGLELLRLRAILDPARPERAAPLDARAAPVRLRRRVGEEAWAWLVAPALAAATQASPDALSEAAALLALRRVVQGLPLRRLAPGPHALAEALAARVAVRCGCSVVRVETETDGARVRYERAGRARSVLADAVVLAVRATAVAALCPKLTPGERGFFETQREETRIGVQLVLDRAPEVRPPPLLLLPPAERTGLASAVFDPGAEPGAAGLLAASLDEAAARALAGAPDAEVVAHALRGLARTPLGRLEVAHARVRRRTGCAAALAPGGLRRLASFSARIERSPRLVFAAEGRSAPGLEGAVTAGARAATQVARALGAGISP